MMISNDRAGLTPVAPVFLVDLFPGLPAELMGLLRGLDRNEWYRAHGGGVWTLVRASHGWRLFAGSEAGPDATVSLDQETVWKLFSKGLDQDSAQRRIRIQGERRLGQPVLSSLAVMA